MKKCEDDYRRRERERERKRMYLINSVRRWCDRYDKYEEYGPAAAGPATALRRRVFICANRVSKDEAIHVCVRSWVFLILNIYSQLTISKTIDRIEESCRPTL